MSENSVLENGQHWDELEKLLSESPAATQERERDTFWRLADPFDKSFVIFGAGQLGRKVARALRQHGIEPLAFADSNPQMWGRAVDGTTVRSPTDAATEWGQRAAFVIAIWPSRANDTYFDRVRQLQQLGCAKVIPYLSLLWTDPAAYLPHFALDAPHSILAEADLIRRCAGLWSDRASAEAFLGILRWRLLADFSDIPARSIHEQYFPDDLYTVGPNDVFVDCGAFDGDTVRAIAQRLDRALCRVIALEPDPQNFAALKDFVDSLGARGDSITAWPYAVGRRRETLRFSATGTDMASVSAEGSVTVEAISLDELLADESPSLIKMDIEGFELEALAGAVEVIRRFRPIMAVTVYHHSDHLWKVPLAIAAAADPQFDTSAQQDYSFFLRSYQTEFWETVCYAVPRLRLK
jgi:FkbM family methyltransferase